MMDVTFAECLHAAKQLTYRQITNICTGETFVVRYGLLDIAVHFVLLLLCFVFLPLMIMVVSSLRNK